jgi:hypothetical protein
MQRLWLQECARFIHDRGELDLLMVAVVQICQPDGLLAAGLYRIISGRGMQGLLAAGLYMDYQQQGDARIISSRVVQGLSAAGRCKDY